MNPHFNGLLVSVRDRFVRSAFLFGAVWIFGAVLLSALHVMFPNVRPAPDPTISNPVQDDRFNPVPVGPALRTGPASPIASAPSGDASAPEERGLWIIAERTQNDNTYSEYLSRYPHGVHVAEARDRMETLRAFAACTKVVSVAAQNELCVGELVRNILTSAENRNSNIDWSSVQDQFGKAIFDASVHKLSNVGASDSDGGVTPIIIGPVALRTGDSGPAPAWRNTIEGLLNHFGSKALEEVMTARKEEIRNVKLPRNILPDSKKAAEIFKRAAAAGDPNAQILLGLNYMTGSGVIRDPNRAQALFNRAGDHIRAAYLLEYQVTLAASTSTK